MEAEDQVARTRSAAIDSPESGPETGHYPETHTVHQVDGDAPL